MHATVPVRFGRGRLDSLGNKGLAAYLIAGDFGVRAEADCTNGTSLSPEALPRSACSEVCNHTRCADIAFFSGSPESPFFQPVFASLAQDQLYRDAVAATGSFRCHSGSWLCRIIGFSTSADRHWLRKMFRNWSISSSYALSSNASTTPVHNAIVPSSARAVPLIEDRQLQP